MSGANLTKGLVSPRGAAARCGKAEPDHPVGQGTMLVQYPQPWRLRQRALGGLAEGGLHKGRFGEGKPCDRCGE